MNLRRFWSRHTAPWQQRPPLTDEQRTLLTTGLAGFCKHGVGMLDQCDDCCPEAAPPAKEI